MAAWRNELVLARFFDEKLHGLGAFVIEDVLLDGDARSFEAVYEDEVRTLHFRVRLALHRFN